MTAEKILKIAKAEIGTKEYPKNSNKVKYNTEYYGREVSGGAYPWCCVFVWWVFKHAGASKLFFNGKQSASCTTVRDGMKAQKVKDPKAGDIVFFNFSGDNTKVEHIGIVEFVNADGTVNTIEGNTSTGNDANGGQVMRRIRKRSQIDCFIRPQYQVENEVKPVKSIEDIAREVIAGKWGNGIDRKSNLIKAGYDYYEVQAMVNKLLRK